jgi:hypothetical protein
MLWAQYQAVVNSLIGDNILIIGSLGAVVGCFIGAILVGPTASYVDFLVPKLALGSIGPLLVGPRDAWRMLGCGNTRGTSSSTLASLLAF